MSPGTLEFTVVSATISRDAGFDFELVDTYATIRCIKEQRSTKTARDQGRLPAWNEVFTFNLEEEDLLKDILVQVFAVKSELDELLGLAKIPILTVVGKTEGTLCSLNCPGKGEVGQLMASWRWTPAAKGIFRDVNPQMESAGIQAATTSSDSHSALAFDLNVPFEGYDCPVSYPYVPPGSTKTGGENTSIDLADAMAKLALHKEYSRTSTPSAPPYVEADNSSKGECYFSEGSYSSESGGAYPPQSYKAAPFSVYPHAGTKTASLLHMNSMGNESQAYSGYPNVNIIVPGERNDVGKDGSHTSARYPPPGDAFEYNYPPVEKNRTPAYIARDSSNNEEKGKCHESHIPYNYPPPMHGAYPPPPHSGYPPAYPPPPPYGHPQGGYPPPSYPPPTYSHVPVYSPVPHGYPSAPDHYAAPAYPPYGYGPPVYGSQHQIPDPRNPGHNTTFTPHDAYVDHSKHEKHHKHSKHEKHEKKHKHSKHGHD